MLKIIIELIPVENFAIIFTEVVQLLISLQAVAARLSLAATYPSPQTARSILAVLFITKEV